jgi:asparagine synthase (glutamine-hydrolysing)
MGLELQADRDQAIAALHGTYLSMPYMDVRVVRAARAIPAAEKVVGGRRKVPLRQVAERHIPPEFAWYEKKAMQYGSGVWKVLQKLARKNGYKVSLQDYINHISGEDHGH